jgi:2-acylglycerol O-acyltransferase 2
MWINFTTESNAISTLIPGIRIHPMALDGVLKVPFWREFMLAHGIVSVAKETCDYLLSKKGCSILIMPGGARESLDARPWTLDLTLRKRLGFVRLALTHG